MDEQVIDRSEELRRRAIETLRGNDAGGWTKPSPRLYPHLWSWDAAFVAIGWAHIDISRAAEEFRSLFRAQWKTGKIPHITFNPEVPQSQYFPGTAFWQGAALSPDVPEGTDSSGLLQPPVHAIAIWQIWEIAQSQGEHETAIAGDFLRESYPHLLAWHRYLMTARDPEETGLIATIHPWEGWDNSPRWDAALAAVQPGKLEPYERADLKHVKDPSQRPTMADYDRYLWLVELMKQVGYDDAAIYERHPFLIHDVFVTATLIAANVALAQISEVIGAPSEDRTLIRDWIARGSRGLESRWDEESGLYFDFDVRSGTTVRSLTLAGLSGIIAGEIRQERLHRQFQVFDSEMFCGNPQLKWPLPPSTSPLDIAFDSRRYWRGPVWPFLTWFFAHALKRVSGRAARLRQDSIAQAESAGFAEYVEPFTGEGLGSPGQSWTAAVLLDWLSDVEEPPDQPTGPLDE